MSSKTGMLFWIIDLIRNRGSHFEHERHEPRSYRNDDEKGNQIQQQAVLHHGQEGDAAGTVDGGVETGSMKPIDAPRQAASAGWRGSTPAARATAIATGTTMVAEAALEVVS